MWMANHNSKLKIFKWVYPKIIALEKNLKWNCTMILAKAHILTEKATFGTIKIIEVTWYQDIKMCQ
jgi:hypothetical protein